MKEIAQDGPGDGAVGFEKFVAKIEIDDFLAVAEGRDELVDRLDLGTSRICGFFAARHDTEEEDGRLGGTLLILRNNCFHALGNLFRSIGSWIKTDITGSDHENDQLGMKGVELSVLQPPQNRLRGVPRAAEIESLDPVEARPHAAGGSIMARGDGELITVEDEVDVFHLLGSL